MKKITLLTTFLCFSSFANITLHAQTTYYVTNDGTGNFLTIAQVNSASLNPGDIVSFKGGEQFTDATLNCKTGVTYNSYGTGRAVIGDSSLCANNPTIQVDVEDVTIDNLKIFGNNVIADGSIILYTKGGLTIEDCEIIGGHNSHEKWSSGLYLTSATCSIVSIQRNKIH